MNILNNEEIHLKVLLGQSIVVDGIGEFHSPLLDEVVSLTELLYNQSVYALLFDKENLESQEETMNHTNFQIISSILFQDISFRELFLCGLNLHFNKQPSIHLLPEHGVGMVYFDELSEDTVLTEEKYEYVKRLVRIANSIAEPEKEEIIEAGNERARQFMEEQKKRKAMLAKYKKPKMNLHSIISAVGWKAQSFNFINQLNIYQLYNGYSRYHLLDNYQYTMNGISAGTFDGSKIKQEDINWANIINT